MLVACQQGTNERPQLAEKVSPPKKPVNAAIEEPEAWETLPSRNAFAGAERCKECHEKKYERWSLSWHARALSLPQPQFTVGRYDGSRYRGSSSDASMLKKAGTLFMHTADENGTSHDYPVQWLIGGKRMQDSVTVFPDGRWQVLPVYFHVTGKGEWVDYNEKKQGIIGPKHPFFWTNFRRMASHECLTCHVTGLDVSYERSTQQWRTSFVDPGVACESCHGPGALHSFTEKKADIVRPSALTPEANLAVCGQCHGPREPLFPLFDSKHRFRPGESYDDKFEALVVVDGKARSGEFFADGRPSSSSFEYQALLQSRCWRQGKATCLSCHTAPHHKHEANDMKPGSMDESCRTCHPGIAQAVKSHTQHVSAKAQTCVACHMPRIISGVLDTFPDHSIDVPNPRNTVAHKVPNACNSCHANEKPEAMVAAIEKMWPRAMARMSRRNRLADAIDEETAAQSQPALVAILRDEDEAPTLRGAVAILLAQRFPRQAGPILTPYLQASEPLLRARVIEALGSAQGREVADSIASVLNDKSMLVRERAAVNLSLVAGDRANAALERLATQPETASLARPHLMLAASAMRRNDALRGKAELQKALDLVPYHVEAMLLMADISMTLGEKQKAREWVDQALKVSPQHEGALKRHDALERMTRPVK